MPDVRFDPASAVTFKLAEGHVHREGSPPQVLIGADALLALALAGGSQASAGLAYSIGAAIGRRVALRLGGAAGGSSVETVIDHLGGELAVSGLGTLSFERWGEAAVLVVDGSPFGAPGDVIVEGIVGAAVAEATGRRTVTVLLGRAENRARFFLGGRTGADKLRAWLAEGVAWGEALARLQRTATPEEGRRERTLDRGDA